MAVTYRLISSNILTTTTASVTFSSIPATYTDLIIKWSVRTNGASTDNLNINYNGLTSGIYSRVYLRTNGSTALTNQGAAQTTIFSENLAQATDTTSNVFSNGEIYIPNYAGNLNKIASIFGTTENNATTAYVVGQVGTMASTAAITSVTLAPGTGSFVADSSFYLYGISNS